ncbi:Asparagine synthetase [glutamine-hydrolyzing] 1 [Arenibacter antarcticus]|uniref:asparagine synthase (glutamine-hydrolyzing) n=1 Tax=Arenibacter antarcticus TaxID=2040469 RepID=A0ABW5VGZ6_9FLAO|nr:asparagine synthase (glutamine-hydrolyzing) [Arenibacter sp. H213]MCM4167335.1 asparagine synthase (glutamine-hydrolyzing) [Arenibacter sp. H213]
MCGIYGTTLNYGQKVFDKKLKRIDFRGPDFTGIQSYKTEYNTVTFGHNRLAILDLDARSNQPFTYSEGIHIVFNGEIYNYLEIKAILVNQGHTFRTTSDTEVICAAYLEYGENCVEHFNGMFAFVIYDEKQQLFFGARDRLGQKPFYYYHSGTEFEFASQISAIRLEHKNLSISNKAISNYMVWGYIPDPDSIFTEIKKLPPGHSFTYHLPSGGFKQHKYWDIDYKGQNIFQGSYEDAQEELEVLLTDAVKKRMIADVPLGIFLSGGIDSSLVAALASKSTDKVKTFSVKFNTKSVDESLYAQEVAKHLGTDHHTIECNYEEGLDIIKNISHYYDEPFSDSSAIPSLLLAKHTKKHVTVALSGDAGDESFLGYHRYNWMSIAEKFYKIPGFLRPLITGPMGAIPSYKSNVVANVLKSKSLNDAYIKMMVGGTNGEWYHRPEHDIIEPYRDYLYHNNKNIYERISDFDLKTYLNGDINTKVDRATMAYSLEARSPFLDYRVVEFGRSLPTSYKFLKNNQKRILKDILYKHVPKELFNRPKAGFTMPLAEWFRSELKEYVLDELSTEGLKEIPGIHIGKVQTIIKQHMAHKANGSYTIWKLLVLKQYLNSIN